jgi:hypothetical protein
VAAEHAGANGSPGSWLSRLLVPSAVARALRGVAALVALVDEQRETRSTVFGSLIVSG